MTTSLPLLNPIPEIEQEQFEHLVMREQENQRRELLRDLTKERETSAWWHKEAA